VQGHFDQVSLPPEAMLSSSIDSSQGGGPESPFPSADSSEFMYLSTHSGWWIYAIGMASRPFLAKAPSPSTRRVRLGASARTRPLPVFVSWASARGGEALAAPTSQAQPGSRIDGARQCVLQLCASSSRKRGHCLVGTAACARWMRLRPSTSWSDSWARLGVLRGSQHVMHGAPPSVSLQENAYV